MIRTILILSIGLISLTSFRVLSQNNALHFDGINDYVECPSPVSGDQDFTFEAWFKIDMDQTAAFKRLVSLGGPNTRFEIGTNNGILSYFIYSPLGSNNQFSTVSVNDDLCHHLAVVKDGYDFTMYLDGVLVAFRPNYLASDFNLGSNMRLGKWSGTGTNQYWKGLIDEVRIWDDVLSEDEIILHADQNMTFTGSEQNLVAYYNFNQGISGGANAVETALNDLTNSFNGELIDFSLTGTTSNWVTSCLPVIEFCNPECCIEDNEGFEAQPLGDLVDELPFQVPGWYDQEGGVISVVQDGCQDPNSISMWTGSTNFGGFTYLSYYAGGGVAGDSPVFEEGNYYCLSVCAKIEGQMNTSSEAYITCGFYEPLIPPGLNVFGFLNEIGRTNTISVADGWVNLDFPIWQADGFYPEVTFSVVDANFTEIGINVLIDNICIEETSAPAICDALFSYEMLDCGEVCFTDESCGNDYNAEINIDGFTFNVLNDYCHVFSQAGTYEVCMTLVQENCEDTYCEDVVIDLIYSDPMIQCPGNLIVNADPSLCEADINLTEPVISLDPCVMNYELLCTRSDNEVLTAPFPVGMTTMECTLTAGPGPSAICEYTVTVEDNQSPSLSCPPDISLETDSGLCFSTDLLFAIRDVIDNCEMQDFMAIRDDNLPLNEPWPLGDTKVTATAADIYNNEAMCMTTITVEDAEPPIIICPADLTVNTTDPNGTTVNLPQVQATDNCELRFLACDRDQNYVFPCEETIVTCEARDGVGLVSLCSYRVWVDCLGDCITFDDQSLSGWNSNIKSNGSPGVAISLKSSGPSGSPSDYYLRGQDKSGSSIVINYKNPTEDWSQHFGECYCWDTKIFHDGDNHLSNPIIPGLILYNSPNVNAPHTSPVIAARFIPNFSITENGPWVTTCAPIEPCTGGVLPFNNYGKWKITFGSGNDCVDWNALVSSVTHEALPIDFTGNPAEIVGWDNFCFEPCEPYDYDTTACELIQLSSNSTQDENACCFEIDLNQLDPGSQADQIVFTILSPDYIFSSFTTQGGFVVNNSFPKPNRKLGSLYSGPIPSGNYPGFVNMCFQDPKGNNLQPIEVESSVYQPSADGFDLISCRDTFDLNCNEVDTLNCWTVVEDSIYCINDSTYSVSIKVKNETLNEVFSSALIYDLQPQDICWDPTVALFSGAGLNPGDVSQWLTFTVIVKDYFPLTLDLCFNLSIVNMTGQNCCSNQKPSCLQLESCCTPCDNIGLSLVELDECCYEVGLENNCVANYFQRVEAKILTNGVTFLTHNDLTVDWTTSYSDPKELHWENVANLIPIGDYKSIFDFCLTNVNNVAQVPQEIQLSWISSDIDGNEFVACLDTIVTECLPPPDTCVAIIKDSIYCDDNGIYNYSFEVENKSATETASHVTLLPVFPTSTIDYMPQSFNVNLPPSGTTKLDIVFPFAQQGDRIKFKLRLSDLITMNPPYHWCCYQTDTVCITMPPCNPIPDCCDKPNFDQDFDDFMASLTVEDCKVSFDPINLDTCGTLSIDWGDGFGDFYPVENEVCYKYDQQGTYEVCVTHEIWDDPTIPPCLSRTQCQFVMADCPPPPPQDTCDISCLLDMPVTENLSPNSFVFLQDAVNYNNEIIIYDGTVKKWDGSNLNAYGTPTINAHLLAVHNGELYAAGNFALGLDNNVLLARYEPSSSTWISLLKVNSNSNRVSVLESTPQGLILGGRLDSQTGYSISNIILYDDSGSSFFPISGGGQTGVLGQVYDLEFIDNKLFIYSAGTQVGWNIDYYDFNSASYNPTSGSLIGPIGKLVNYKGNLLAFGQFTMTNDAACGANAINHSAEYDISANCWVEFGGGMDNPSLGIRPYVADAKVIEDNIILIGRVQQAGFTTLTKAVFYWDGATWADLGGLNLVDQIPHALACRKNSKGECELFYGGEPGFFRLYCPSPCETTNLDLTYPMDCIELNESINLSWNNECPNIDVMISLFEAPIGPVVGGSVLTNIPNTGSYTWTPPAGLPSGDYYIQIETTDGAIDFGSIFQIGDCSCTCGAFMNQAIALGGTTNPVNCGSQFVIPANPGLVTIDGDFSCIGMCANDGVFWQMTGPDGLLNGSLIQGSYSFSLPANYFSTAGTYSLVLSANCDGDPCDNCGVTIIVQEEECVCIDHFNVMLTTQNKDYLLDCDFNMPTTLESCPQLDNLLSLSGEVHCSGGCAATEITWSLEKDDADYILDGNTILKFQTTTLTGVAYNIDLSSVPRWEPGRYSISSTGLCDADTKCQCHAEWIVPDGCSCDCRTFMDPSGIIMEPLSNFYNCTKRFSLSNVGPCDRMEWEWTEAFSNSPVSIQVGTSIGNTQVTFTGEHAKTYFLKATIYRTTTEGIQCQKEVVTKLVPVLCEPLEPDDPRDVHQFYHDGLLHTTVGAYTIDPNPADQIIYLSEMTEKVGLDIELGETKGYFSNAVMPALNELSIGDLVECKIYGQVNGESDQLISTRQEMIVALDGERYVRWTHSFEGSATNELVITNGEGIELVRQDLENGMPLFYRFANGDSDWDLPGTNTEHNNSRSNEDNIFLILPDNDEEEFPAGSTIELIALNNDQFIDHYSRAELRWEGIESAELRRQAVILFDDQIFNEVLGNEVFDNRNSGEEMQLINPNDNFSNGLRLSFPFNQTEITDGDQFTADWTFEEDEGNKGIQITLTKENIAAGQSNEEGILKTVEFEDAFLLSYEDDNPEDIIYCIYNNGELLAMERVSNSEKNLEVSALPVGGGFKGNDADEDNRIEVFFKFDNPESLTINGNTYDGWDLVGAYRAVLEVDGKKFRVGHCTYSLHQNIDENGVPSTFVLSDERFEPFIDSVDDLLENQNFKVYPNPTTGELTLLLDKNLNLAYKVEIVSPLGQVVNIDEISQGTGSTKMNLKEIEAGIYFIVLKEGNKIKGQRRFIKL